MTLQSARDSFRAYYGDGLRQAADVIRFNPLDFIASLLRGTWVLLRLLVRLLRAGLRRATSSTATPAPALPARKGPPPKVSISKEDGPPPAGQEGGQEAGEEPPAKAPKGKTPKRAQAAQAAGGWLQNAALTLLVLVVAGGTLSSVWAALVYLLRPYATITVTVLVLAWIAAALTADAVTRPEVDHGEDAGEEDVDEDLGEESEDVDDELEEVEQDAQESEPVDPWPAQRELLRQYVEHRVTACASGLKLGVKGRGARVDDLLEEQQQNGGLIGFDRKAMIELLQRAGITVRTQMKFRVREPVGDTWKWTERNLPGVHIEDLAEDLGRTPRVPAHLVADITPGEPPVSPEESPRNVVPIPLARTARE